MKTRILFSLLVSVLIPSFTFAAKPKKNKKATPSPAPAALPDSLKPHDANGNGKIDADESAAVKKAFADNPKGQLAALDKNGNGQLEDAEMTAATSSSSTATANSARPGKLLKRADKNRNKKLDPEEVADLQKSFDADPKGALAKLDRNGNKKLDDKEIAKINERMSKAGKGRESAAPTSKSPTSSPTGTAAGTTKDVETVKPAEKPDVAK